MEWTAQVDGYCERMDPSFWAEPLNAFTNAAFILGTLVGLIAARRAGRTDGLTYLLIALLFAIGTGSFLWHTFAQRWAGLADSLPILLFILVYLYGAMVRFVRAPIWAALLAPVAFIGFAAAFLWIWSALLPSLNGSQGYFPAIILLVGYGLFLRRRGHEASGALLAAGAIFAVSLTFRSIDEAFCDAVPFGTHFMWHTLNGLLLGVLLVAFVRHGAPSLAPSPARG